MKNTQHVENNAQGADLQKLMENPPSVADIIGFLDRDLGLSIRCLQGIHHNPNLKAQLAEWMAGEILNHQERLKQQQSKN